MNDELFNQNGVPSMIQGIITHLDQIEGAWRKAAETQIQILSCGEIMKGLE